jgi:nicotinamide-nucleotide amidase
LPDVEILAIGTELLLGQLLDTNTAHIASTLADAGVNVYATHAVGDNRERIAGAIRGALERADGVVTSGGLGPTIDDLTKEAVCDVLDCKTQLNEAALVTMQEIFARSGRQMRENNRKQAEIPASALPLVNNNGTAPGFIAVRADGKFIASMPGVPHEMKPMLAEQLVPWLRSRFDVREAIHTRVLHTVNIAESEIDYRIEDLFRVSENPKIAVLAHDFRCDVKIMAKAASREDALALIVPVEHEIAKRLDGHVFGVDDQTLAGAIHVILQQRRQTLSVAESVTGGSIGGALTATPGASKSFIGGVVAYDNAVKVDMLGVSALTLRDRGAVSEEVAKEMALGVRARLKTNIGLSSTGIAGPSGGSPGKPVGLVWIGVADGSRCFAHRLTLRGERDFIRSRTITATLGLLWKTLAYPERM